MSRTTHFRPPLWRICVVVTCLIASAARGGVPEWDRLWIKEVQPILDRHCFKCHGGVRQRGGLDIRSLETMLRGGEGGPAVVSGQPALSRVHQFVHPDAETRMPPEGRTALTGPEIQSLARWIRSLPSWNPPGTNSTQKAAAYTAWLAANSKPIWNPRGGQPVEKVIDGFMARGWRQWRVHPAARVNDSGFLRRVHLDLAGRIPTEQETQAFFRDKPGERRERLVDRLLAGPDYPRRMREVFDVVLLGRAGESQEKERGRNHWHQFLEESFRQNRRWDEVVHSMIVARAESPENRGSQWFLYERRNDHQAAAEAMGPLAFGMRIDCAQCHNHPLAWEVEQRHYWGLVAALKRSRNVETTNGPAVSESAIGGFISFMNLKKESQPAHLIFPNGREIAEVRPTEDAKEQDLPVLYRIPPPPEKQKPTQAAIPIRSRRESLADALARENPMLARAFVNRIWALLHGRGLIHPVDEMDSRNRSNHPELLDWLSRDFQRSGYDVKRLIRGMALARPYQLESRSSGAAAPPPESFAKALDKPLTAEQIVASLQVLGGTDSNPVETAPEKLRRAFVERFPEVFASEYNASLQQAMFLSNSPLVEEAVGKVVDASSRYGAEENVRYLFKRILGRDPEREELERALDCMQGRKSDKGLRQLAWALIASPEFLLNH